MTRMSKNRDIGPGSTDNPWSDGTYENPVFLGYRKGTDLDPYVYELYVYTDAQGKAISEKRYDDGRVEFRIKNFEQGDGRGEWRDAEPGEVVVTGDSYPPNFADPLSPSESEKLQNEVSQWFDDHHSFSDQRISVDPNGFQTVHFRDHMGKRWEVTRHPDGNEGYRIWDREAQDWREPEEGAEPSRALRTKEESEAPMDPNSPVVGGTDVPEDTPPDLPPGVELQDVKWLYRAADGGGRYGGVDQSGRKWEWSRNDQGDTTLGYTDKAGNWHEMRGEQDGTWNDIWKDKNGNEHLSYEDNDGNWHASTRGPDGVFRKDEDYLPSYLELKDHYTSRDSDGNVHASGTDQYGRRWEWSRDAQGELSAGFTDLEGQRHEVSKIDGTWYDTFTDEDGNQHRGQVDEHGNVHDGWTDASGTHHDEVRNPATEEAEIRARWKAEELARIEEAMDSEDPQDLERLAEDRGVTPEELKAELEAASGQAPGGEEPKEGGVPNPPGEPGDEQVPAPGDRSEEDEMRTQPPPEPDTQTPEPPRPGLSEAEVQALKEAGLTPDQIGWVEARVVDPEGIFTMEWPGFTDQQWELIGGIQDQRAAQTTTTAPPPPPTEEEAGTSGTDRMADSELDRDYWYPEHMPPGLELRDHHTWTDEHGNEHRVYTDQYGRKWDWSGEKEARSDNNLGYTDADGRWHQVSAYDGVWMDTSWDENGEVRSGELGATPEEPGTGGEAAASGRTPADDEPKEGQMRPLPLPEPGGEGGWPERGPGGWPGSGPADDEPKEGEMRTPPLPEPGGEGGWPERGPEGEYTIPEIERPDLYGPGTVPPPAGKAGERQPGTQTPEPRDGEGGERPSPDPAITYDPTQGYTADLVYVEPGDPRLGTHPKYTTAEPPNLLGEVTPPPRATEQPAGQPEDQPAGEPGEEGGVPSPGDDGEGGIPGLGVPYRDFIPTFPMVKDPTTGQWRNAEPGEIPGPRDEGGEPLPDPAQRRAEELERAEQAQQGRSPNAAPAGGGDEGHVPGMRAPVLDFIPFFPVGQDPDTGEWRYEHAHGPELAKKWAEDRGIQPPPPQQPPPPSEQETHYLDQARQWAGELGIDLPPSAPPLPPPEPAQDPDLAGKWAQERGMEVPPAPPPPGGAGGPEAEQTQEDQRRAEELERAEQAQQQGGPQEPPGDDGEGGIPGLGVPYRDFIPTFPMVKDPTTGQWRNAEPGEIPGPPVVEQQPPSAEQPVQPAPPPDPYEDGINPDYEPPPAVAEQPPPLPLPPEPSNGGWPDPGEVGINPDYQPPPAVAEQQQEAGWEDPTLTDPTLTEPGVADEGFDDGLGA